MIIPKTLGHDAPRGTAGPDVRSVGLIVTGGLAAAVFLKGTDQVLRYSVDRSTVELLYLPVGARIRSNAKAFIDTVVWRTGDAIRRWSVEQRGAIADRMMRMA
jgi:ATP/ADP translocase